MVKILTELSKLCFSISFLVVCVKCDYDNDEFESQRIHDLIRFERIKNDLFTRSNEKLSYYANSMDDWKCLEELNTIEIARTKFELWAEKIVDAWGKLPSGILDGNVYDFGSFSECFHIDRNGELYKTKYCLGQAELHMEGIPKSKYSKYGLISQPDNGSALTFGVCLPVECSAEFVEKYFMEQTNSRGMPIKLLEDSCQIEEYPSTFTTLDWFATAFLIIILTVILMSTAYDIHCAMSEREKHETLSAFSFYSNGKKLLSCESPKSKDVIRCLDGIRALTSAWLLFGHLTEMFYIYPKRNTAYIETFHSRYTNMIFFSMRIGVVSFFAISGLLVTISILKQLEKTKGKISVPMLYLHRYLRLTPPWAVSILIAMSLYRFIGNGPLWPSIFNGVKEPCERKWWLALLYVQNYADPELCLSSSWYLSVDMQLYIISPLIIYSIYRSNKKTIYALLVLVFACIGYTIALHLKTGWKLGVSLATDEKQHSYYPTHIHYSSWLIGVITGYIFHENRNKIIRIPRIMNVIGWTLSIAIMYAIVFGYYPLVQLESTSTPLQYGLYHAFSRVGWSTALCYIIFACHHNYGGPVNWFLGHRLWQPLSRLSYSTFLFHQLVMYAAIGTTMNSLYFTERTCFLSAILVYILTMFVSMIATLAFEMPITIIDKLMLSRNEIRYDNNQNDIKKLAQH